MIDKEFKTKFKLNCSRGEVKYYKKMYALKKQDAYGSVNKIGDKFYYTDRDKTFEVTPTNSLAAN